MIRSRTSSSSPASPHRDVRYPLIRGVRAPEGQLEKPLATAIDDTSRPGKRLDDMKVEFDQAADTEMR